MHDGHCGPRKILTICSRFNSRVTDKKVCLWGQKRCGHCRNHKRCKDATHSLLCCVFVQTTSSALLIRIEYCSTPNGLCLQASVPSTLPETYIRPQFFRQMLGAAPWVNPTVPTQLLFGHLEVWFQCCKCSIIPFPSHPHSNIAAIATNVVKGTTIIVAVEVILVGHTRRIFCRGRTFRWDINVKPWARRKERRILEKKRRYSLNGFIASKNPENDSWRCIYE